MHPNDTPDSESPADSLLKTPLDAPSESSAGALPFEDAVQRLEDVVRDLESGDIPLETALARFEEGVRLSRYCLGVLDSAQGRIERLMADLNGELRLEPIDGEFA